MINDIEFSVGMDITDACYKMYQNIFEDGTPQSTNFNGVRIIMFKEVNK